MQMLSTESSQFFSYSPSAKYGKIKAAYPILATALSNILIIYNVL